MATVRQGVILVGHGGIPRGCPQDWVTKLKRLEGQRRAAKQPASAEELQLDVTIRQWPRNAETDPYQAGRVHTDILILTSYQLLRTGMLTLSLLRQYTE